MPGVPSSRACKACRAQKKKCDQRQPSCSRCTRLNIKCVEGGQKRFKFVEQRPDQQQGTGAHQQQIVKRHNNAPKVTVVLPTLMSATTVAGHAFIDKLTVSRLGYQFNMVGGYLFLEIPKRMGYHEALDRAATAMLSAFTFIMTGENLDEAKVDYGRAMGALRVALLDRRQGATANTLCTIWLLMICQGWIGRTEIKYGTHLEGLCHVMNAFADSINWKTYSEFDAQLVVASSYAVVMEQLCNPRVRLGTWMDKLALPPGPPKYDPDELQTIKLRKIDRATKLLIEPVPNRVGLEVAYREVRSDIGILRRDKAQIRASLPQGVPLEFLPIEMARQVFVIEIRYSLVLPFALLLNYLLGALTPGFDEFPNLSQEMEFYVEEMINLARNMQGFRPIGTETMPRSLGICWAVTDDVIKQKEIEAWIKEYDKDFMGANNMIIALYCRAWIMGQYEKWAAHCGGTSRFSEVREVPDAELDAILGPGKKCCIL